MMCTSKKTLKLVLYLLDLHLTDSQPSYLRIYQLVTTICTKLLQLTLQVLDNFLLGPTL